MTVFTYVVVPLTNKLALMITSPVIVPPLFASNELLARIKAAAAEFVAAVMLVFCVRLVATAPFAVSKAALA